MARLGPGLPAAGVETEAAAAVVRGSLTDVRMRHQRLERIAGSLPLLARRAELLGLIERECATGTVWEPRRASDMRAALTAFDLAYLQALYHMAADRSLMAQRSEIGDLITDRLEK